MTIDRVRAICSGFPHVTEDVKWEHALVFSIGKKMFAVVDLEPDETWLAFKCTPEEFAELTERPGCRPAPYLARAHWVALESRRAMPASEIERRLREAYDLVLAKLPKKLQRELGA